jgi:glycogen phosphorylase
LRFALLTHGDPFMHLADLSSYMRADGALCDLYRNPDDGAHKVILNIAGSGKFSSDRTIREYANDICRAQPCPVR